MISRLSEPLLHILLEESQKHKDEEEWEFLYLSGNGNIIKATRKRISYYPGMMFQGILPPEFTKTEKEEAFIFEFEILNDEEYLEAFK